MSLCRKIFTQVVTIVSNDPSHRHLIVEYSDSVDLNVLLTDRQRDLPFDFSFDNDYRSDLSYEPN